MKLGVTLSSAAHVAILSWGLLSLSSPQQMEVADVEALPVDIVPIEALTQTVRGDSSADVSETPAPTPTSRPEPVENAQNAGDADTDDKPVDNAKAAEASVEAGAEPADPTPPTPVKEEVAAAEAEDKPTEATELAALDDPAVPVTEEPVAEEPKVAETGEQFAKLPDAVPVPVLRPKVPKANTAKTTKRKKQDDAPSKEAKKSSNTEAEDTVDKVAKLINRQDDASSGAKRSTKQASLGADRSNGEKLSQSEMDALRSAIERCSSGIAGREISQDLTITVKMELNVDGTIRGDPVAAARGGTSEERSRYVRDILRFVKRCAPYDFLPKDKYDTWAEVIPTFYPHQMFN